MEIAGSRVAVLRGLRDAARSRAAPADRHRARANADAIRCNARPAAHA